MNAGCRSNRLGLGGLGDDCELARQRMRALLELVLVLELGVEPLQPGAIPERVRLLRHGGAPRHAMLHQRRCVANMLEDRAPAARRATGAGQLPRKRLDQIESAGNFVLIACRTTLLASASAIESRVRALRSR